MSNKEIARTLYHPKSGVEEVVDKMCELFDSHKLHNFTFQHPFRIGDLAVKSVEREKSHSAILIHWEADHSTKSDPFCSAYILTLEEINAIYFELKRILL